MAEYIVTITNGTGSELLPAGNYNVAASVTGYDGALDPTTFAATTSEGSQAFTLAATETLTLNVNETGALGGTPITSGTFIRCSQDGAPLCKKNARRIQSNKPEQAALAQYAG